MWMDPVQGAKCGKIFETHLLSLVRPSQFLTLSLTPYEYRLDISRHEQVCSWSDKLIILCTPNRKAKICLHTCRLSCCIWVHSMWEYMGVYTRYFFLPEHYNIFAIYFIPGFGMPSSLGVPSLCGASDWVASLGFIAGICSSVYCSLCVFLIWHPTLCIHYSNTLPSNCWEPSPLCDCHFSLCYVLHPNVLFKNNNWSLKSPKNQNLTVFLKNTPPQKSYCTIGRVPAKTLVVRGKTFAMVISKVPRNCIRQSLESRGTQLIN